MASERAIRLVVWGCLVAAVVLAGYSLATRHQRPLEHQPSPDAQEYADAARHLAAGDGYVTTVKDSAAHPAGLNPPRYPPGYPLVLAPFGLLDEYPLNVQRGAKLVALAYFVVVAGAALSLGGPLAALLAVVVVWGSPFAPTSIQLVMSDALGALLAVALLPLVQRATRGGVIAAGALAGFGVVVRLNALVVLAALLLTLRGRNRLRAAAAAAPFVLALGVWQWVAYGAPWRTGYSYWLPGLQTFALGYATGDVPRDGPWLTHDRFGGGRWFDAICPPCNLDGAFGSLANWAFYPLALSGLLWVTVPPLVGLAAAAACWVWRRQAAARLTLWTAALTFALQLVYFYQASRFTAAAGSMLTVMAAVAAAHLLTRYCTRSSIRALAQGSFLPGGEASERKAGPTTRTSAGGHESASR